MLKLVTFLFLIFSVLACQQDAVIEEQTQVSPVGAGPETDDASPADENAAPPEEEEAEEAAEEEEAEEEEEEEVPPPAFADFNALAVADCGGCHGAGSGRMYLVNDEQNAMAMAQNVKNRINAIGNVMPTAGMMEAGRIAMYEVYLDFVIEANQ